MNRENEWSNMKSDHLDYENRLDDLLCPWRWRRHCVWSCSWFVFFLKSCSDLTTRSHHISITIFWSRIMQGQTISGAKGLRDLNDLWQTTVTSLTSQRSQLEKFRDEYKELDELITELPNKTKHKIMVCPSILLRCLSVLEFNCLWSSNQHHREFWWKIIHFVVHFCL